MATQRVRMFLEFPHGDYFLRNKNALLLCLLLTEGM